MDKELDSIDLSFSLEERLSAEKLSAFESALEHSYNLYRQGLALHSEMLGDIPNKHIKLSLKNARNSAEAILSMIEKYGDVVVLDKEHAVAMLMPMTLAASELLNTEGKND